MAAPTGKTFYERSMEAVRLVGAGNAAGLLAIGASINSGKAGVWFKFSAASFAMGVLSFALCYWLFFDSWTLGESNFTKISKLEAEGKPVGPTEDGAKGKKKFLWGVVAVKVSIFFFVFGFIFGLLELIR